MQAGPSMPTSLAGPDMVAKAGEVEFDNASAVDASAAGTAPATDAAGAGADDAGTAAAAASTASAASADAAAPAKKKKHWDPLESNPQAINTYMGKLGYAGPAQWVELFSTEEWAQSMVPGPHHAVLLNFQTFMAHALDGFAHAAEAMGGRAIGARDRDGAR